MTELVASFARREEAERAAGMVRRRLGFVAAVEAPGSVAGARARQQGETREMGALPATGLSMAPGVGSASFFGSLAWGVAGAAAGLVVGTVLFAISHRGLWLVLAIVAGAVAGQVAGFVDVGASRATEAQQRADALEAHAVLRVVTETDEGLDAARHMIDGLHPSRVDILE